MREFIEQKLIKSQSVTLIVDIWASANMADYIALAAIILNENFERETFVVGISELGGISHSALNCQDEITKIVNGYPGFDKNKIKAVVCDEGSEFVALFDQIFIEKSYSANLNEENLAEENETLSLTFSQQCSLNPSQE